MSGEEAAQLRAEVAALKAQVERLEARLNAASGQASGAAISPTAGTGGSAPPAQSGAGIASFSPSISWKGAPQIAQDDRAFKVKGRMQYDAGVLMAPAGVTDGAKGFSTEARRLRLGVEGKLASGFGYKLETELSDNSVSLVDAYLSYEKGTLLVTLGNQNEFQSLDELVGDSVGSVMERAAFTHAFGFERRLGLAAQYRTGDWLAQGGLFTDSADSLSNGNNGDFNNSYGVDGRLVFAPKLDRTQLHFGLSGHWRDPGSLSALPQRYRERPYLHTVNTRYLSTPAILADSEMHYGAEFAGTRGPLHWAGEAHWLRVARPGLADPTFFGGYAELGYFLTGETRAYRNGVFGSTAPRRPFGKGGFGAVQINLRYDYLDMNDAATIGGTQNALIGAIIWTPIEFLRFNFNYGHIAYTDAVILAGSRADYGVDVIGMRAELDF